MYGGQITTIYVPKDKCGAASICLYAHDGSFKLNNPTDVPESCRSNDKHPCNMCKFEAKVRTPQILLKDIAATASSPRAPEASDCLSERAGVIAHLVWASQVSSCIHQAANASSKMTQRTRAN